MKLLDLTIWIGMIALAIAAAVIGYHAGYGSPYTSNQTSTDSSIDTEWLALFADNKMKDLLRADYWAHTNSDGCDFKCRAAQGDRDGRLVVGEDLYKGPCDLGKAYKMWQDSPKHKEILDAGFENLVILGKKKGDMCYITYEAQYTK